MRLLEHGIPARALAWLANDLRVEVTFLSSWLGVSSASPLPVARHARLPNAYAESVLGVAKLIGQLQASLPQEKAEDFDVEAWLGRWLQQPLPAIGGRVPHALLATATGRLVLGEVLNRAVASAYG